MTRDTDELGDGLQRVEAVDEEPPGYGEFLAGQ